jgi:hypothetical protein
MMVVGSKFTSTGCFLKRVLGVVLRDNGCVSPHQHVSRVVLVRTPRFLGFCSFFWVLFERFAAHSDGVSSSISALYSYYLFWTVYYHVLIIIIILFIM